MTRSPCRHQCPRRILPRTAPARVPDRVVVVVVVVVVVLLLLLLVLLLFFFTHDIAAVRRSIVPITFDVPSSTLPCFRGYGCRCGCGCPFLYLPPLPHSLTGLAQIRQVPQAPLLAPAPARAVAAFPRVLRT